MASAQVQPVEAHFNLIYKREMFADRSGIYPLADALGSWLC